MFTNIRNILNLERCEGVCILQILKNASKWQNSIKKSRKLNYLLFIFEKSFTSFNRNFEFGAVRRCVYLVDLEKCCKMSIWSQKSALIQRRTSLSKFQDELFILSQIQRGSFSAVSTPIFATKYSFCSIFRDLMDLSTFAPLRTQNSSKKLVTNWVKNE